MDTHEFEVTVRVRKRLHLAGPADRETARQMLKGILSDGVRVGTFAVIGNDGRPVETILDNDFTVDDPTV